MRASNRVIRATLQNSISQARLQTMRPIIPRILNRINHQTSLHSGHLLASAPHRKASFSRNLKKYLHDFSQIQTTTEPNSVEQLLAKHLLTLNIKVDIKSFSSQKLNKLYNHMRSRNLSNTSPVVFYWLLDCTPEILDKIAMLQTHLKGDDSCYRFNAFLELMAKTDSLESLLAAIYSLDSETIRLDNSLSLSRRYSTTTSGGAPYPREHLSILFKRLVETRLLEKLLQCKNLPEVWQLSSIFLHEGLGAHLQSVINLDEHAGKILKWIQVDNAVIEKAMEVRNKDSKTFWNSRRRDDFYKQQFAESDTSFHCALINHVNIAEDIITFKGMVIKHAFPKPTIDQIVETILKFKNHPQWKQIKTEMAEDEHFFKLVFSKPDSMFIALDLIDKLKATHFLKKFIISDLYYHHKFAHQFHEAFRIATGEWATTLSTEDYRIVRNKVIEEKELRLSYSFFKVISSQAEVILDHAKTKIDNWQRRI